jgi:hypothetical protein
MMRHSFRTLFAASVLVLAGCTVTGHSFDASSLSRLTPGQTTMPQAAYLLSAPPDQIYPQSDGTTLALWRVHMSVVPDAIYGGQEALLQFGPDGRFIRMVDRSNIPLEPWERQRLLGVNPMPAQEQPAVAVSAPVSSWPAESVPPAEQQGYVIPVPPAPAR